MAWGWSDFRGVAGDFYRELEQAEGGTLFHEVEIVRLFASERERNWFDAKRRDNPAYTDVLAKPEAWDEVRRDWAGGVALRSRWEAL